MHTITNLTPHDIVLVRDEGGNTRFPASGEVARVSQSAHPLTFLSEEYYLPLVRMDYGEVVGLPTRKAGVVLIVSAMVRQACPDRADLVSPGELVRDAVGRVTGCRNFVGSSSAEEDFDTILNG